MENDVACDTLYIDRFVSLMSLYIVFLQYKIYINLSIPKANEIIIYFQDAIQKNNYSCC